MIKIQGVAAIALVTGILLIAFAVAYAATTDQRIPMPADSKNAYQALYWRMTTDQTKLQSLVDQFIQQNPDAKRLSDDYSATVKELQTVEVDVFKKAGLKFEDYAVDPEKGEFVLRQDSPLAKTEKK